jgi:hypothetical protein
MEGMSEPRLPNPRWIWRTLQHVPGFQSLSWNKIYTEARLGQEIRIGVRGDGGGIDLYRNGDDGRAQIWLDVVNMAPFPIEIDRITGELTVDGATIAQINALDRHTVPARRWKDVYFEFPLSSAQLHAVEFQLRHRSDAKAGLRLRVYFESETGKGNLTPQLESGNCRFTNFRVA